jgi:hypothetical protein
MGTVHKFKRPPKNQQQFRGYRPKPPGIDGKPPRGQRPGWQKSLLAWSALLLLAAAIWGIGKLLGG